MEANINPEELITLVQERGVLWDKTLNDYKDKQLKISAWRKECTSHVECLKLALASSVADNRLLIVCVNKGTDIRLIYGSDTRQVGTSS